jgi:hypothetical protein
MVKVRTATERIETMLTEVTLRQNPGIFKAFMGIPAEVFWMIVGVVSFVLPEIDQLRLKKNDRKRQPGAGRSCD